VYDMNFQMGEACKAGAMARRLHGESYHIDGPFGIEWGTKRSSKRM
jgi:hypothetical protein